MEVYVDDMLVKSKEESSHLNDPRETFDTLRKYQMKLIKQSACFGFCRESYLDLWSLTRD